MQNNKIYSLDEIKQIINENKNFFKTRYFVDKFLLFGSYAKNQQTVDSDIDLLVDFTEPIDMFDFMDLQEFLSHIFRKKIDLGTTSSLKKFIKEPILKEAIVL